MCKRDADHGGQRQRNMRSSQEDQVVVLTLSSYHPFDKVSAVQVIS